MAFSANDRVKVTSKNSEHRRSLGTVETEAAVTANGFNHVRLDGSVVGDTVNLADNELHDSDFVSPIQY